MSSTNPSTSEDMLRGVSAEKYGSNHQAHTLEIYKICVEMADRISARRERMNSFFLTVNAVLLGGLAHGGLNNNIIWALPLFGVFFCCVWCALIKSYKTLNLEKFKVIHSIERHLPWRPYIAEWGNLQSEDGGCTAYYLFSLLEKYATWILLTLHCVLFIFFIVPLSAIIMRYITTICG